MFLGDKKISATDFKSYLYIQYHCLDLTLTQNKLTSLCHSINLNIKLELVRMFKHHKAGIIAAKKSPHFPCGLKLVTIFGFIFKIRYLIIFKIIKKYKLHKKENQNHHQYCH